MSGRIKPGDDAIIINALSRGKSPNIGKRVTVGAHQLGNHGQDSVYGPVHHCKGPEVYQMDDSGNFFNAGWADIPLAWLQKADPVPPLDTSTSREKDLVFVEKL